MGQHLVTHDPCDPSDFRDPFDTLTHDPSTHSLLWSTVSHIVFGSVTHVRLSVSRCHLWCCLTLGLAGPTKVDRSDSSIEPRDPLHSYTQLTTTTININDTVTTK